MALTFTDNGIEYVNCGSAGSIDGWDTFTYFAWIYIDGYGFRFGRILSKGDDIKELSMDGTGSENASLLFMKVGRGTTAATASTSANQTTGEWRFVAGTYDETDGPRLFHGNLSTAVAEVSYATREVGSGTTNGDAIYDLYIGNRASGTTNRAFGGRIAVAGIIEKRLTLAEIKSIQYRCLDIAKYSEAKALWDLHGTSTQPDLTGNGNNGTVTGATAGAHVPLRPMFGFDEPGLAAGAAAASTMPIFMHHYRQNIGQ